MSAIFNFIQDSGIVGWFILLTGAFSVSIIIERTRVLHFKYRIDARAFTDKILSLLMSKKPEEALIYCAQLQEKPLAKAFKQILEKSDRGDDVIFQAQDIAMAEAVPFYTKRLHYLSMLANVATLLGLLGTIHGLIISFQAVAQADPAQKQALLANGISVSMYTTALGLAVAIPLMVAYSFLIAKQNEHVEQLTENCSKLTEALTNSFGDVMNRQSVFPDPTGVVQPSGIVPPSANNKVG